MRKAQEFEVTLLKPPDIDGAYFIVPFNVPEVYGTKAHVKEIFDKFSYTHKKEYVEWIEGAKKQVTRENRIKKAVEQIGGGKKR